LNSLPREALLGLRRGIEKESLRVTPGGALALTPHPPALGAALTHPHITTDFSESQLELITGVHSSAEACLEELERIHQFVYRNIGDEILWCASMPCGLPADDAIPIGRYGTSNSGRLKTVYRNGLAWRYGRRMQTISGIHYNFSLPGMTNESYFALIRNFRRISWLPIYLFGASPAVCGSFVDGRNHELQPIGDSSLHLPYATSLRMGRLGYQSDAQSSLHVSYNSLASYGASLYEALTVPYPPYEKIGIRGPDGEYRQLATSLLQIENEFYTTIRAKQLTRRGERPLHALRERGVEYVEVRLMDLDPFAPLGITAPTIRLLDLLLLWCHLNESAEDTPQELAAIARNKLATAQRGREPGLLLERGRDKGALAEWGGEILEGCAPVASALDAAFGGAAYRDALAGALGVMRRPETAPSARVLHGMARDHANAYVPFVLALSLLHGGSLRNSGFPADANRYFARLAGKSLEEQKKIEAGDSIDFETYRSRYLSPDLLKL
jgi:glutamate--cysteine ligase